VALPLRVVNAWELPTVYAAPGFVPPVDFDPEAYEKATARIGSTPRSRSTSPATARTVGRAAVGFFQRATSAPHPFGDLVTSVAEGDQVFWMVAATFDNVVDREPTVAGVVCVSASTVSGLDPGSGLLPGVLVELGLDAVWLQVRHAALGPGWMRPVLVRWPITGGPSRRAARSAAVWPP